jgi:hypothetical protein
LFHVAVCGLDRVAEQLESWVTGLGLSKEKLHELFDPEVLYILVVAAFAELEDVLDSFLLFFSITKEFDVSVFSLDRVSERFEPGVTGLGVTKEEVDRLLGAEVL